MYIFGQKKKTVFKNILYQFSQYFLKNRWKLKDVKCWDRIELFKRGYIPALSGVNSLCWNHTLCLWWSFIWIFTAQFPSLNLVLMLIRFHGFGMHLEQVCCVSLLFCWPIQRPCGTDPRRTAAFHLWPFVVSAGHSGSMQCVQPEDLL